MLFSFQMAESSRKYFILNELLVLFFSFQMAESSRKYFILNEQLELELTCTICVEYFIEPIILPCSHSFCKKCIEVRWFKEFIIVFHLKTYLTDLLLTVILASETHTHTHTPTYICYSKIVKLGISWNPWIFQWFHEIPVLVRGFMKSLKYSGISWNYWI